jgi:hypothetical protein
LKEMAVTWWEGRRSWGDVELWRGLAGATAEYVRGGEIDEGR